MLVAGGDVQAIRRRSSYKYVFEVMDQVFKNQSIQSLQGSETISLLPGMREVDPTSDIQTEGVLDVQSKSA